MHALKTRARRKRRTAFTLIELLVIAAISAVLIALLFPAVQRARESARRMQCRSNLKQLAMAMHTYENSARQFPMAAFWNVDTVAREFHHGESWGQALLPHLDQQALADDFDRTQPIWSGARNRALITTPLAVFHCPSNSSGFTRNTTTWSMATVAAGGNPSCGIAPAEPITATWGNADYIVNTDVRSPLYSNLSAVGVTPRNRHGMFYCGDLNASAVVVGNGVPSDGCDHRPTVDKVTDGLSNTIMIGELSARNQLWEMRRNVTSPPATDTPAAAANFYRLLNQQTHFGGGGWADPNNTQWVDGGNRDGNNHTRDANDDRNSCVINCTNLTYRAFYSFHTGMSMFAMGDGSVKALSEDIDDFVLAFLLTRAGSEVVGDY